MPRSLRDHLEDQFSRLEQDSMKVIEYEAYFYELSRYSKSILTIEYKRVYCIIQGLRLHFCMSTQSLVVVGRSFAKVFDHAQHMEEKHHQDQGESNKSHDM